VTTYLKAATDRHIFAYIYSYIIIYAISNNIKPVHTETPLIRFAT